MKCISIPSLTFLLLLSAQLAGPSGALGQETMSETAATPATVIEPEAVEEDLAWSDYTVKAYTLGIWAGNYSSSTYLENTPLIGRTVLEIGAGDIDGYDGNVLEVSRDTKHYTGATKAIEPTNSYGGRIGIYIADAFHLDLVGSYASGVATTTMLYTEDPDNFPDQNERILVDSDPDFKTYKGGLALLYDAHSASIFGIFPRLGFGLGGIINRYSVLEDKTALYLEGSFGLNYELFDGFELGAQVDLTTYAFQVDELDYSQIVNYATYSLGISWFIDRVPEQVRSAHIAENN